MSGIRIQFTATAFSAVLLFLIAEVCAQSSVANQYGAKVSQLVNSMYPKLEDVYKDIHAHPELGFQETRTAAKLAAEMSAMGFQVTEKVGKTGVVAIFRNGPGPTVLVRTELDALPVEEKTGLPYASTVKSTSFGRETFVAHSCGHDIHMASWLGIRSVLISRRSVPSCSTVFGAPPRQRR